MSAVDDIQDDYLEIDETETVTLASAFPTGSSDATVTALRRPLSRRDVSFAAQMGYSADSVVWCLFTRTMGSLQPRAGWTITDSSGDVFVILSVSKNTFGTWWRCVCNRNDT